MVDKPVLTRIWANNAASGDVVDPDVQEGDGTFEDGWEAEIPPYEYFNFLQKLFTQALAHINERGVPEWDADTPYLSGVSYVTGSDGNIYKAKTNNTGNDPTTSPTHWGVWPAPVASATTSAEGLVELATDPETQAGTDTQRAVTPAGLASVTATTTRRGLSEKATQTEVNSGSDPDRYITPATLNGKTATTSRRGVLELATEAAALAGSNNTDAITPETLQAALDAHNSVLYPVGSVYINANTSTNPATLLGFGTWTRIGQGRVLIGAGSTTDDRGENRSFLNGSTGGEFRHVQTAAELAQHNHNLTVSLNYNSLSGWAASATNIGNTATASTQNKGSSSPMNVTQPYLGVYIWKRTA